MASTDEQLELVVQAQAGDRQAFDALVSRHRSRVYYLALSMLGSRDTAMDIAQDAFVQAYLSLGTLRSPEKFASWLMAITRNLCLMHLRRSRETAMPEEYLQPVVQQEPESDVLPILDSLPKGARSAALLYFVEEMKQAEIAEFLGISLSAVKSRIRDARLRLQKEMIDMVKRTAKKEPGDEFNKSLQHKLELARWYREFADMITSGVTLMTALNNLKARDFSPQVKEATVKLASAIQSDASMSDALADLSALTISQTIGMVRAGEVGGVLDWTMQFLADWIEIENGQRELELAFWCRTVGSVIDAGAPVEIALDSGFGIVRSPELKEATRDIAQAIESAKPLAPVLDKHAGVLLPIVRVAIMAGEKGQVLGFALQWAANAIHGRMAERLLGREFKPPTPTSAQMKPSVEAFAEAAADYLGSDKPEIRAAATAIVERIGGSGKRDNRP